MSKTRIVLEALGPEHLPVLVIAPKRVAENVWPEEMKKWRPELTLSLAIGEPKNRTKELGRLSDVTVISRDNMKDVPAEVYRTVVLDELSGFKSRQTRRWKTARKLTKTADYVWGLTGTPASNGLLDLWAQMFLLDRGERLGTTLTHYRNRYFTPGRQLRSGVITEWNIRPGAEKRIYSLIDDICISLENLDLDLPPVTHNEVSVPLPPRAMKTYREMKKELVSDIRDLLGEFHTAKNAAVLSSKLSQVSAGFLYSDMPDTPATHLHDQKIDALREIIDGTGSPILVFYHFRAELEKIRHALPEAVQIDDDNNVIERWNAGKIPVLLAHPASAGHGLNLQYGGHTIVWMTAPWSLELYGQANARLARQGQTEPVIIHHLISPDTVDRAILERLAEKKSVENALLDHLDAGFTS